MSGVKGKLFNVGLTDRRTHNKLIIRLWGEDAEMVNGLIVTVGLHVEYEVRYIREDNYFTAGPEGEEPGR